MFCAGGKAKPVRLVLLACGLCACGPVLAQDIWNGSAGTTNWSTPGNWSFGYAPLTTDPVLFDNFVPGVANAVVDNIVDADFTIYGLNYQTATTNNYHTTLIYPGLSLNINGSGALLSSPVFVGTGSDPGANLNVYYRVVGGGTLTVTNAAGAIRVVQTRANNADHRATLDLSGLTNFTASVGQILVGSSDATATIGDRPMGTLLLADTNLILIPAGTARPGILVGGTGTANIRGTQYIYLGRVNTINADAITAGGYKTDGRILFRSGLTGGAVTLRGSLGGTDKVKLLSIADQRAETGTYTRAGTGTSNTDVGVLDTTDNFLDALIQDLYVGRSQTNGSGGTTATLTFNQGAVQADNMYVGYHSTGLPASGQTANATGTVNVNGSATLTVNNDLTLTRKLGSSVPTATLNLSSNGTVNILGNILTSGGTSTINLNDGGTINMLPPGDAAPGYVSVSTLTGSGTITNAANVTNTLALTPGGAATAGTLVIATNLTLATNAALNINLGDVITIGGGVNDYVNVTGDLNLNSNALVVIPIASSAASGSYRLIDYTGNRNGFLSFTNPTRYNVALDYPANQVNLTVSGSAGSLRWNSATSAAWDTTTSNWFNTGTSATDQFLQLDSALVDDSGAYTNLLLLNTILFPNTVTVNSSTLDYFFGGSGRFSGAASLTKNGTSMLTVSNVNDFTGPVQVNGGILRVANSSALGSTNSGTTIASGATLDINGISLYNPGELITIAGTGADGAGAVINTGAGQNNAIRYLTLSDNATIRQDNRFDVRGPGGNSSFSGVLDLGGFTLTKVGAAQFSLADVVATNAGSVDVQSGIFAVTRSQVDGPGVINLYTNALQIENSTTGYCAKPIVVDGGVIRIVNNSFTLASPITNLSGVSFDVSGAAAPTLTITNLVSGAGGVIKSNAGSVVFEAANTYSGPTTILGGRLALSTNASLAATPSIAVNSGIFDVSALPSGFTLATGQTLSGAGSVVGDVSAGSGTTVMPGSSPGTLTFSNNLALNSATLPFELSSDPTAIGGGTNDLISVATNLSLSGVNNIQITPLAPLNNATPYTLMVCGGTLSGLATNLSVVSDSRYTFTPSVTANSVQVQVVGSGAAANLLWAGVDPIQPTAWDAKTTYNWTNGAALDQFWAGDNVTFDDSGRTNLVDLIGSLKPAIILVTNNSLNYTFAGAGGLTAGSLTKEGSAALVVNNTAANSFGAGLILNGGTIGFGNSGANSFGAGGPVRVNAGSLTFTNASGNTFSAPVAVNAGSLLVANPAPNTFNSGIDLTGGSMTFDQPLNTIVSGTFSNTTPGLAGSLVKAGANVLTLSGNNTNFDGPILVDNGILRAANTYALGNNNGSTTVADGATLDINGASLYNPGDDIIIYGAGVNSTGAVINTGAAQNNAIRSLILSNNASIAAWGNRWDIRGPLGSGSLSGNLNLNGFTLTKLGSGQNSVVDASVLNASVINVAGGTLTFTRCDVPAVGYVNVSSNTLAFDNYSSGSFSMPVTVNGGIIRQVGSAFTTFYSMITNQAGGLALDNNSGNTFTVNGDITGPGNLAKTGADTVVLTSANNAWGGSTTVAAGTLQLGSAWDAANGSLPDLPIVNNGALSFMGYLSFTNTTGITGTGTLAKRGDGVLTLTASNSFAGNVTTGSGNETSGSGGTIVISNSYALGNTNKTVSIVRAELQLGGPLTIPPEIAFSTSANSDVTSAGAGLIAMRNIGGNNVVQGPITLTSGGGSSEFRVDAGQLTLNGDIGPDTTARVCILSGVGPGIVNGAITNRGANVPAVEKRGEGTWTLNATNTYSGRTTVQGGTLVLGASASIAASSPINVQTGATLNVSAVIGGFVLETNQVLMGEGTVIGGVTVNGTVSPGASIGTLTFANNLVLAGTNIMEIDRTSAQNADLVVANALTCGGELVVTNIGEALQANDTFDLLNAGTFSGAFAQITLPPLNPGLGWDTSTVAANGIIKVVVTVPTTPTNIAWSVSANNLTLSWPKEYIGWTLLMQTNNLATGVSTNSADWGPVPGSTTTNEVTIPLDAAKPTEFYRMAYPYP